MSPSGRLRHRQLVTNLPTSCQYAPTDGKHQPPPNKAGVAAALEATGRALALGKRPGANADLADLGLLDSDTASRALALSTVRHGILLWQCALGRALHHTDEAHVAGVSRQGCAPRHIRASGGALGVTFSTNGSISGSGSCRDRSTG